MGELQEPRPFLDQVLRDAADETARLRSSARLPNAFEKELDLTWDSLSPRATERFERLQREVAIVRDRSEFDLQVPVESSAIGGRFFKRLVRKTIGWYLRFFVAQLQSFSNAVTNALHTVELELRHVRARQVHGRSPMPDDLASVSKPGRQWWWPVAIAALRDAPGRVLHAGAGTDEFLAELTSAGLESYALAGQPFAAVPTATDVPDPWSWDVFDHLSSVRVGDLGGLVLQGPVQWLCPEEVDDLLALTAARLAPGGRIVVVSSTPEAWARALSPVLVDLAPGHPLHPETWVHLMQRHGLPGATVHLGGGHAPEIRGPGNGADLDPALDAVLAALGHLLPGPDEFVVVAARGT